MKKVLAAAVAALSVLLPASSSPAMTKDTTGPRINVLTGTPTTFPAGQPFFIRHGWSPFPELIQPPAIGQYGFTLEVDGVQRAADFEIRDAIPPPQTGFELKNPILVHLWVFNFPAGMTGTHSFTGHWFRPCGAAVEFNDYPLPCRTSSAQVLEESHSLTVTFTP